MQAVSSDNYYIMSRLDIEIVNRGMARSRSQAQMYITDDQVIVNRMPVNKANKSVSANDEIEILNQLKYVSRGGLKLEHAISKFYSRPELTSSEHVLTDMYCLDIGSSTGGFTDCLLQHGALHVTAIDVGTDQMDQSLKNDTRVTLYENTDIRKFAEMYENKLDEIYESKKAFDLIVIDVSFISLAKIIPYLRTFCYTKNTNNVETNNLQTKVIALIKPQFEVGREHVRKGGVVRDEALYKVVIDKIREAFEVEGFHIIDVIDSPITGGDGNKEFLIYALGNSRFCFL